MKGKGKGYQRSENKFLDEKRAGAARAFYNHLHKKKRNLKLRKEVVESWSADEGGVSSDLFQPRRYNSKARNKSQIFTQIASLTRCGGPPSDRRDTLQCVRQS